MIKWKGPLLGLTAGREISDDQQEWIYLIRKGEDIVLDQANDGGSLSGSPEDINSWDDRDKFFEDKPVTTTVDWHQGEMGELHKEKL